MAGETSFEKFVREELPGVIDTVTRSRAKEIELSDGLVSLSIRRRFDAETEEHPAALIESASGETGGKLNGSATRVVMAPIVGIFYHSEQPGGAALISAGAHVDHGSMIGVIEALGVTTEVESDIAGTITSIMSGDGEPVEYGQPLVEVLSDG